MRQPLQLSHGWPCQRRRGHRGGWDCSQERCAARAERFNHVRMPSSGLVDRFGFRSLYFREPNGILFEIATDGPGFATDESMDTLGETLSLPPFLEGRRQQIEGGLKQL
jgi:glyoxalase family protein